jgi:bacterioferritin-associated ferredoxin
MYICVCKAVTEKQIFQAAQAGARRVKDLKNSLGVASECGRCATCAKSCLSDARAALAEK